MAAKAKVARDRWNLNAATYESKLHAIEGHYASMFGFFSDPEEPNYTGIYGSCQEHFKRLSDKYTMALSDIEAMVVNLTANAEAPPTGTQQPSRQPP